MIQVQVVTVTANRRDSEVSRADDENFQLEDQDLDVPIGDSERMGDDGGGDAAEDEADYVVG